jgi:hypothetical protein
MAASVMLSSVTLKPAGFTVEKTAARGLPSLTRARFLYANFSESLLLRYYKYSEDTISSHSTNKHLIL